MILGPPEPFVLERPWSMSAAEVAAVLGTDPVVGLTPADAERRLATTGRNELVEAVSPPAWLLLARQFADTLIVVLAVAGVVALAVGERTDALVIGAIVVLNAVIGFVQEYRAERAMAALRELTTGTARVVRDGALHSVPIPELVPGDLVRLAVGDVVPADLRLVDVEALRTDESSLTGESEPVWKIADAVAADTAALGDRLDMAYRATAVTHGRGAGVVVATGNATEVGRIATLLGTPRERGTPLQRRLGVLGRQLAVVAVVVCAVVFVSGVLTGEPADEMFLVAVGLAVAAIPEGLAAVVTISLALGARRMARRRSIVRHLPAVETLGSVSVICADKTGTLTENRMAAERVWTPEGTWLVEGVGYAPVGRVRVPDGRPDDERLSRLAEAAALCNDAVLHPPDGPDGDWGISGDPTEAALVALAGRLGVDAGGLVDRMPRCAEIAFDGVRRRMTTVHRAGDAFRVAAKGALEALAPCIHADDAEVLAAARVAEHELASVGYRVLAVADGEVGSLPGRLGEVEDGLRMLGLVAIADPPRVEAADAVATCRAAGVTAVMITGDHPGTAVAIARRLGFVDDDAGTAVMTGKEVAALDDRELALRVPTVRVFARTSPEQKLRIVDAWQANGAIVAMTGDGVNDAPALHRADIGVAMGVTGTDVAKEAADMVLADDDFGTIVDAVEEGRRIYDNIRRFVRYMLGTNSGEVAVMLLAPLLGLPVPLTASQILWINLVTDGLPAVALGLEPAEGDVMRRGPRRADESILGRGLWRHALAVGSLMAVVVLPMQAVARAADLPWQTMVFTTLAFLQLGNAAASRARRRPGGAALAGSRWLALAVAVSAALQLAAVYVPPFQQAFDTEPLSALELLVALVLALPVFVAVEVASWRNRRRPQAQ